MIKGYSSTRAFQLLDTTLNFFLLFIAILQRLKENTSELEQNKDWQPLDWVGKSWGRPTVKKYFQDQKGPSRKAS